MGSVRVPGPPQYLGNMPMPLVRKSGVDLIQCVDDKGIGGRRPRVGAETHLVNQFLLELPFSTKPTQRLTIFQEPKLISGFPDLVAVIWHKPTANRWMTERASITRDEVRILHILACHGSQTEEQLKYLLQTPIKRWIDRLANLGLISNRGSIWKLSSIKNSFAVRHIIALEAKISDFSKAVEQASLNKWFASESYVLLPKSPKSGNCLRDAQSEGVGIWIVGDPEPILRSPVRAEEQPKSYASWLFNEWAWRSSVARGLA